MQFSGRSLQHKIQNYAHQSLVNDLTAGLTGAIAGAPQAMAFAIVAGINPIYGLYTAIITTIVSSLFGSSTFMTTGPTNALAVVVGSTLAPFAESGDLVSRLITLTFLVGVIQTAMGLLRLGDLTRYVSTAVMVGFITGASMLVLLGQLRHLTGMPAGVAATILGATGELLTHLDDLHLPTFLIGVVTIGLIVLLHHTRVAPFATLIAIVLTGTAVVVLGWDDVELVGDQSTVSGQLPDFTLPESNLMGEMLPAALAIGLLGLVQTAALAQSIKEPDDRIPDASREFIGQGLGNLVGAFFQNMPAGGSLSRTAVNLRSGARTRWANIWSGVFVAIIMLLFGGLVERIALATLAGQLVVAAAMLISPARISFIWRASWPSRWAMVVTFVSTFLLPLQYSVYVGVFLSLVLYVHQSSHVRVVQLEPVGINTFRVAPIPARLPDARPIILSIQGNLFFAAMRNLQEELPAPNGAKHPVVILRLRGDTLLAGTGASMLVAYAERLRAQGGKLILCGVEEPVVKTLARTGALHRIGQENVFLASDLLLMSTQTAFDYARSWLEEQVGAADTVSTPAPQ